MAAISINGEAFPNVTSYKYDVEPIGQFERNANGKLVGDKITDKIKLSCAWDMIPGERYAKLIAKTAPFYLTVSFTTPDGSTDTRKMYPSPQSGQLLFITRLNEYWWKNVTCDFIEV
jgi:hypothetical protein